MIATISSSELLDRRLREPDLRLIDVRTGGEFETMHIPGSVNVPLTAIDERAAEIAAIEGPTILVCQSGARSGAAAETLDRAGKTDLVSLDGGVVAWQAAGGEIATGAQEKWAMDRQVRLAAGSLVLTGILGSIAIPKAKWLAGGIGTGLVYSALSNTCTMGDMLAKLPYNQAGDYDLDATIAQLKGAI